MFAAARNSIRVAHRAVARSTRSFASEARSTAARNPAKSACAVAGATLLAAGAYAAFQANARPVETAAASLAPGPKTTVAGVKGAASERTFIAVKPDGVQRGLVGEVIKRFEARGYKLVALKLLVPSRSLAEKHYEDLKTRPFFNGLVDYMTNGKAPVVAMVWEGKDVIRQGRRMIGATNPLDAIRADYCTAVGRNIIHGSDSYESAVTEISLWFGAAGLTEWDQAAGEWIIAEN